MPRARYIKPGFFLNEDLAALSPLARLLFAGLWTIADGAGRLEYRPKRIKAQILPYDDCDCVLLLDELCAGEKPFLRRYSANGGVFLQVVNWQRHQKTHPQEQESAYPPEGPVITKSSDELELVATSFPNENDDRDHAYKYKYESKSKLESKSESELKSESTSTSTGSTFEKFWHAYPPVRRRDKKAAHRAYARAVAELAARGEPDPEGYLLLRAQAYAQSDLGRGQYSKMPASWLNAGAFDDDDATWRASSPREGIFSNNAQAAEDLIRRMSNGRSDHTQHSAPVVPDVLNLPHPDDR